MDSKYSKDNTAVKQDLLRGKRLDNALNEYKKIQKLKTDSRLSGISDEDARKIIQTSSIKPKISEITSDNRSEQQRKIDSKYYEDVTNPSLKQQVVEATQLPLRYLANPLKITGDLAQTIIPKSALAKDLPNTSNERYDYRKLQLNPKMNSKTKLINTLNTTKNLTTNALINIGTTELAYAIPRSYLTSKLLKTANVGSKANLAADLFQISNTDLNKIKNGDTKELLNLGLNTASAFSKLNNFDASTVYSNLKNWKNISKADKIDTSKDIFNLSQGVNQQTQRVNDKKTN